MTKRGRPRGLVLNVVAFEEARLRECLSKGEIAQVADMTTGHLADALYRRKGVAEPKVRAMAERLRCEPATIAPQLDGFDPPVPVRDLAAANG